eukprot:TRINITY_DN3924_c0_g1_i5.p1 TRINITY_DN3924_c0_g1~~TRINITY_DN3924_c0_g1_i5.p1  ORF type:complete len:583 (+),score=119.42 TRINITY_DN3924_c0_g1_i5:424-2172(+)
MFQRETPFGNLFCKFGGLLQMLDANENNLARSVHSEDIPALYELATELKEKLRPVVDKSAPLEQAVDAIESLMPKIEVMFTKHIAHIVTMHRMFFQQGLALFKSIESEITKMNDISEKKAEVPSSMKIQKYRYLMTTSLEENRITRVFGASLNEVISHEANAGCPIPLLVEKSVHFLKKSAYGIEGIFRISGNQKEVDELRSNFEQGLGPSIVFNDQVDPHNVSGLLKLYLRELPNPLLTFELYDSIVGCDDIDSEKTKLEKVRMYLNLLPKNSKLVFQRLLSLFTKICQFSDTNKMSAENISLVFAPVLLRPVVENQDRMMIESNKRASILAFIIRNAEELYPAPKEQEKKNDTGDIELRRRVASVSVSDTPLGAAHNTTGSGPLTRSTDVRQSPAYSVSSHGSTSPRSPASPHGRTTFASFYSPDSNTSSPAPKLSDSNTRSTSPIHPEVTTITNSGQQNQSQQTSQSQLSEGSTLNAATTTRKQRTLSDTAIHLDARVSGDRTSQGTRVSEMAASASTTANKQRSSAKTLSNLWSSMTKPNSQVLLPGGVPAPAKAGAAAQTTLPLETVHSSGESEGET